MSDAQKAAEALIFELGIDEEPAERARAETIEACVQAAEMHAKSVRANLDVPRLSVFLRNLRALPLPGEPEGA